MLFKLLEVSKTKGFTITRNSEADADKIIHDMKTGSTLKAENSFVFSCDIKSKRGSVNYLIRRGWCALVTFVLITSVNLRSQNC